MPRRGAAAAAVPTPPPGSKQAILDAARHLFAAKGFTATAITEIAEDAGTSIGLVYYHFGSKKQLYLAIWDEYDASARRGTEAAENRARAEGLTGLEVLLAGLRAYLHGAWEARDLVRIVNGRDAPAAFGPVIDQANAQWSEHNLAILADYPPRLSHNADVMIRGAMETLCRQISRCTNSAQAGEVIGDAMQLFAGLLDTLEIDD